jgi:uncharacterized cupredoxin-like copper-binding protein
MFKRLTFVALLVLVLPLVLAACGSSGSAADDASTTISLNMQDFQFEPSRITVPGGKEITLHLSNTGAMEHNLTLMVKPAEAPFDGPDTANIYFQKSLKSGESATVTFTAPAAPGEYQLVCSVPGHIEAGMVGTMVVVQP